MVQKPSKKKRKRKKKVAAGRSGGPRRQSAEDFYQNWRERVRQWVGGRQVPEKLLGVALAVPDFLHLLTRLIADPRVPLADKARMGFAVAYLASPIDLMPEIVFGPAGLLDDVAVVVWALRGLLREEHWGLIEEHWAGDQQVIDLLAKAADLLGPNLGSGRWHRFRRLFGQLADAVPPESLPRPKGRTPTEDPDGKGQ